MPNNPDALNRLLPSVPTSVSDLRNLIRFLKKRPDGISALEITDIYLRRMFEPHKLSAYATWGIVDSSDSAIRLTPLGFRIAQALEAEALEYKEILGSIPPYRAALEWIATREDRIVRFDQVAEYWDRNFPGVFTSGDSRSRENCVINFFHLCHIAEFGTAAVGRKGQPTRFTIDPDEVARFLDRVQSLPRSQTEFPPTKRNEASVAVFCSGESDLDVPFREILEIAGLRIVPCFRKAGETAVSPSIRRLLSNCRSAIVVAEESIDYVPAIKLSDTLIIEIAVASVMFDANVLLAWRGSGPPPFPFGDIRATRISRNPDLRAVLEFGQLVKEIGL